MSATGSNLTGPAETTSHYGYGAPVDTRCRKSAANRFRPIQEDQEQEPYIRDEFRYSGGLPPMPQQQMKRSHVRLVHNRQGSPNDGNTMGVLLGDYDGQSKETLAQMQGGYFNDQKQCK